MDRTDELTDYEFEYEFHQEVAYKKMLDEFINSTPINVSDGGFEKQFSMDDDAYNAILEMSLTGEYVDFNIPKDADMGKVYSSSNRAVNKSDDLEPVDMTDLFGGEKNV